MPRPPSHEKKIRLSLELTERVRDRLERLREQTEADSLTEVIRRALTLYDTLQTVSEDGRLIIRGADGQERELIIP